MAVDYERAIAAHDSPELCNLAADVHGLRRHHQDSSRFTGLSQVESSSDQVQRCADELTAPTAISSGSATSSRIACRSHRPHRRDVSDLAPMKLITRTSSGVRDEG